MTERTTKRGRPAKKVTTKKAEFDLESEFDLELLKTFFPEGKDFYHSSLSKIPLPQGQTIKGVLNYFKINELERDRQKEQIIIGLKDEVSSLRKTIDGLNSQNEEIIREGKKREQDLHSQISSLEKKLDEEREAAKPKHSSSLPDQVNFT